MIEYIQNNEFVSTDTEFTTGVGTTLEDYRLGMYIKLNDEQIAWMHQNPDASPLEVFLMKWLSGNDEIMTPDVEAYNWYRENIDIVRINGQEYPWFDWRFPLLDLNLFRDLGETEFVLQIENDQYKGNIEDIRNFLLQFGRYQIKSQLLKNQYLKEMHEHPENTVNYKEGFLDVPSISNLERIC